LPSRWLRSLTSSSHSSFACDSRRIGGNRGSSSVGLAHWDSSRSSASSRRPNSPHEAPRARRSWSIFHAVTFRRPFSTSPTNVRCTFALRGKPILCEPLLPKRVRGCPTTDNFAGSPGQSGIGAGSTALLCRLMSGETGNETGNGRARQRALTPLTQVSRASASSPTPELLRVPSSRSRRGTLGAQAAASVAVSPAEGCAAWCGRA
jgi:hypothetical protein